MPLFSNISRNSKQIKYIFRKKRGFSNTRVSRSFCPEKAFFECFFRFFSSFSAKSAFFFCFFSVFGFLFLKSGLCLGLGFLPFGRNVHISHFGICCEKRGCAPEKSAARKQLPLCGLSWNMTWSLDKSRLKAGRNALMAVRCRRCRI